jgi:hypothetical protein
LPVFGYKSSGNRETSGPQRQQGLRERAENGNRTAERAQTWNRPPEQSARGGPGPGFEPGRQAPQACRLPGYLTPSHFSVDAHALLYMQPWNNNQTYFLEQEYSVIPRMGELLWEDMLEEYCTSICPIIG